MAKTSGTVVQHDLRPGTNTATSTTWIQARHTEEAEAVYTGRDRKATRQRRS